MAVRGHAAPVSIASIARTFSRGTTNDAVPFSDLHVQQFVRRQETGPLHGHGESEANADGNDRRARQFVGKTEQAKNVARAVGLMKKSCLHPFRSIDLKSKGPAQMSNKADERAS